MPCLSCIACSGDVGPVYPTTSAQSSKPPPTSDHSSSQATSAPKSHPLPSYPLPSPPLPKPLHNAPNLVLLIMIPRIIHHLIPKPIRQRRVRPMPHQHLQHLQIPMPHSRMHRPVPAEPIRHVEEDGLLLLGREDVSQRLDRPCATLAKHSGKRGRGDACALARPWLQCARPSGGSRPCT